MAKQFSKKYGNKGYLQSEINLCSVIYFLLFIIYYLSLLFIIMMVNFGVRASSS